MLELQNVTKRYGKKTVLDDVSIQFKRVKLLVYWD